MNKAVYPIDKVSCKYGAPRGRCGYGTPESSTGKLRLFHVQLSEGYDAGGVYWGSGQPLYCVYEPGEQSYLGFVRADSRKEACEKLGIDPSRLKIKLGQKVGNYSHAD